MRRAPRVPLNLPVTVNAWGSSKKGRIGDLSPLGMFVHLPETAKPHRLVNLTFQVPPRRDSFNVLGRVVRQTPQGCGAEFLDLDCQGQAVLWENLARFRPQQAMSCHFCGRQAGQALRKVCPHCHQPLEVGRQEILQGLWSATGRLPSEMIATCAAMNRVFHLLDKVAGTDVPVLITGPSGTGKEMVAQAIHRRSLLAAGPFVPINCGAIPRELLESELFGHEKGSFTGAYRTVVGTVERAQGGTLFLDEVGELPLELQVKLLRFLQEHTFQRVGGRELLKVNLRVVSATNTPLADLMASGRFREDLYYRLDVVNIDLPPLMDREEDVLILSLVFLKRYARQMGKEILGYTRETPAYLQSHSWPGNIRELINRVRRAVILADGPWVGPEHLGFPASHRTLGPQFEGLSLKEARQQFESRLLAEMLQRCQGNARQAAQVLKVSRSVMYHLIQKYSLKNHLHPGGRSS